MSDNGSQPAPEVTPRLRPTAINPETLARTRRETWWHITFPVAAMALLGVAAVVLVALGGPEVASVVAGYSLILISLLGLIFGLLGLIIFVLLTYMVLKAIGFIPPYTYIAQQNMSGVHRWVDQTTNRIAGAVITAKSVLSGVTLYMQQQGILRTDDGADQPQPDQSQAGESEPAPAAPVTGS